eukprot:352279-Chlamydomonas_euryale.AAC.2
MQDPCESLSPRRSEGESQIPDVVIIEEEAEEEPADAWSWRRRSRRWCRPTAAGHNNLSASYFGLSLGVKNMDSAYFGRLNFHNSRKSPVDRGLNSWDANGCWLN